MTKLLGSEGVFKMPPLGFRVIEAFSEEFLKQCAPSMLVSPQRLDVASLVDDFLPRHGIHVNAGSYEEMGDAEGLTDPEGGPGIEILITEYQFDLLPRSGMAANRARATTCHELGHAMLHVPVIRRRQASPRGKLLLKRVAPTQIKTYEDPEWQAWAFAGCILMPKRAMRMLSQVTPDTVAHAFGVSEAFAKAHLRRSRLV